MNQYIDTQKFLKNTALILMKNGKKFDTYKDMIEFVFKKFTPEQIDETITDMSFCEDKQHFWNACTTSFIETLEEMYQHAWENVSPEEPYEEVLPNIDYSFNETIGVFNFFFNCVENNAQGLKKIEESGLGDIFRIMGA